MLALKYFLSCTDTFIFPAAGYFYFMLNSVDYYRAAICGFVWKCLSYFRITHFHINYNFMQFTYKMILFFQVFWTHSHLYTHGSFLVIVVCYFFRFTLSSYKKLVTTHLVLAPSSSVVLGEVRLIFVRFKGENRTIHLR